ncbi:MAG: toll/interleukin-1 receptor domain-containing protein [Isosphaeraceae bacterium]
MAAPEPDTTPPKAFISYSWDDDAHKDWVKQLAARLRKDGVEVTLDLWHSEPGDHIPAFMEHAVRVSDFVIAVCTPRFKERLDGRRGGVGWEGRIMTGYAFTDEENRKFIPVLRRGKWTEAAPDWLRGTAYIDLSGNPYSEPAYEELLRTLHGAREKAPPLGRPPNFGDRKRSPGSPPPAPVTQPVASPPPQHQTSINPAISKRIPSRDAMGDFVVLLKRYLSTCRLRVQEDANKGSAIARYFQAIVTGHPPRSDLARETLLGEVRDRIDTIEFLVPFGWPDYVNQAIERLRSKELYYDETRFREEKEGAVIELTPIFVDGKPVRLMRRKIKKVVTVFSPSKAEAVLADLETLIGDLETALAAGTG